jgi:hypothetical protein
MFYIYYMIRTFGSSDFFLALMNWENYFTFIK